MEHDLDLFRRILLDIEASPPGESITVLKYPEYDQSIIMAHVGILEDEKFIDAKTFRSGIPKTVRKFWISGLTLKGSQFLKNMGDDSFFKKIKDEFIKSGASYLISFFWEFVKMKAKEKIGLP